MRSIVAIILLSGTLIAEAQPRQRAAWEWTLEERLAARFDEKGVEERRRAFKICQENPDFCRNDFVVDGYRNPELLMPSEIMAHLHRAYDDSDHTRKRTREKWLARAASLQLDDRFFEQLEKVVQIYVDAEIELIHLFDRRQSARPEEQMEFTREIFRVADSRCFLRTQALAAARQAFGRDSFDRFLYTAMAPDVIVMSPSASRASATNALLRIERGCQ